MAAGLGFKNFQTGEVLTAADVNGYLMQGILVFASEAARNAAITSPQEGQFAFTKDNNSLWYYTGNAWAASGASGDIEGVTAGVGISGGGTSGTVTITNSMATEIDAKGDLVAGTGADTFSRLAVGANGTVLTADSTQATGLKWNTISSGGWTSLGTATLSSTVTSISFTATGYQQICLQVINPNSAGAGGLIIKPNGSSVISCMVEDGVWTSATRVQASYYKSYLYNGSFNINGNGSAVFYFDLPANTSTVKAFRGTNMVKDGTNFGFYGYQGFVATDSALSSFSFEHQGGNFTAGSVEVWGIK